MGKHSAPQPHGKAQVSIVTKVVTHHAAHCATIVVLHVVALGILGYMTPVLTLIGIVPSGAAH